MYGEDSGYGDEIESQTSKSSGCDMYATWIIKLWFEDTSLFSKFEELLEVLMPFLLVVVEPMVYFQACL